MTRRLLLLLAIPWLVAAEPPVRREIFVPHEALELLLEGKPEHVLLPRREYEELAAKARIVAAEDEAPQSHLIASADYDFEVQQGMASVRGTLRLDVLADGMLGVAIPLQGVRIRSAVLDDKPAPLGRAPDGGIVLFVSGRGPHVLRLEMFVPVETTAARQSLAFQLPPSSATTWRLLVPGNVEVKSGAAVVRRTFDDKAEQTQFELLPERGPATLVLSLNNRALMQDRVVLARSVFVEELTESYDRLHATISLTMAHGAADRLRWAIPEDLDVLRVETALLSRWAIASGERQERILEVSLREAVTETVVLNVLAERTSRAGGKWSFPQLLPQDVASHTAVVGVMAEERLVPESLSSQGLIPIDATVLQAALPQDVLEGRSGQPRLRPVAAFYASRPGFELRGEFRRSAARLETTSNLLLTLSDKELRLRGGFAVLPQVEKRFDLEISLPGGWQVQEVVHGDGSRLSFDLTSRDDGSQAVRVLIPQGAPPGAFYQLFVTATRTPAGWLGGWSEMPLEFPRMFIEGTARDIGALGVQATDDLLVLPDQLSGLTPLDEAEKAEFGLNGIPTHLAYRYEAPPYRASLRILRPVPRLRARTLSFLRVEPDGLHAHYELIYQVEQARARQLALRLPAGTPTAVAIRGIDVSVKEFRSEMLDGERRWIAELAEPCRGSVRLAVDFQQALPEAQPRGMALPVVKADGVAYQSGMVSVEGSAEFDVRVQTTARAVDVGELADAEYQVGKRLLGAFAMLGEPAAVTVDVLRRPEFGLPAAIVQKAELVSLGSEQGRLQTAARYLLRTKALFLEVALPPEATLWSMTVDGRAAAPQRERDRLLVSLPPVGPDALRDVHVVYETTGREWRWLGRIDTLAPRLVLPGEGNASQEVPTADLEWHLLLPDRHRILGGGGSVSLEEPSAPIYLPLVRIGQILSEMGRAGMSTAAAPEMSRPLAEKGYKFQSPRGGAALEEHLYLDPSTQAQTPPAPAQSVAVAPKDAPRTSAVQPPPGAQGVAPQAAESPTAAPGQAAVGAVAEAARREPRDAFWALQGVRSLPIDLVRRGPSATFRSMGVEPRLQATVADEQRLDFLTAALALVVALGGLARTRCSWGRQARFVAAIVAVALAAPLVIGLVTDLECQMVFQPMVYVAGALAVWYVLAGLWRTMVAGASNRGARWSSRRTAAGAVGLCFITAAGTASAQNPPPAETPSAGPAGITADALRDLIAPPLPVKLPAHAIIIPYRADDPQGVRNATSVLMPYGDYVSWWNRAFPDKPLEARRLPAAYAFRGVEYRMTLDEAEHLTITGRMELELFSQELVAIPLPLAGGVLTALSLDGRPGRVSTAANRAASPDAARAEPPMSPARPGGDEVILHAAGTGVKVLEITLRFPLVRGGGWRTVEGQVPASVAGAWEIQVPRAQTELRFESPPSPAPAPPGRSSRANGPDAAAFQASWETVEDQQLVRTAIGEDGHFRLRWRARVAAMRVEPSLTASSVAMLDVQEEGIRATWRVALNTRRGVRDSFVFTVPSDYLVERVLGANVKGWESRAEGERQTVEVTLLRPSAGEEVVMLVLSRFTDTGRAGEGLVAPVVALRDAALHQGMLAVRRSPLLDVRVTATEGLSRADAGEQEFAEVLTAVAEPSPLGIRPFQVYRFAATPFLLRLSAAEYDAAAAVEVQSLLKIGERESRYEARLEVRVEHRPRYGLQCELPTGLHVDGVEGPAGLEWTLVAQDTGNVLQVYLPAGQRTLAVVLRGRFGPRSGDTLAVPRLRVRDVGEQRGHVVIQVDPAYDVRAEGLRGCESVLLERVHHWLREDQRALARVALLYPTPDFDASVRIVARQPRVQALSITNVRVTPFAIEDTVYLQWGIQDAGIREISFLLPAAMRGARITVPLLRQKTVEDVAETPGFVRVRLELQDDVTRQLVVLVQDDRPLAEGLHEAPIPRIETGRTDQRFVVLESAGRDEVTVPVVEQLTELTRQQSEWGRLTAILGEQITQAFVVRDGSPGPKLALQTRQRAAVRTVGARIGLAKTILVVDPQGAYRGIQEYQVDNKTEQFLEVELPQGASLWTARVAGDAIKPAEVPGAANRRRARVPLIKTAAGDLDYPVVLKYGGQLPLAEWSVPNRFPFLRTINIQVEQSQVELNLPATHRWFGFGGTVGLPRNRGDLLAGYISYQSKQVEQLLGYVQGSADDFSKIRAANNLRHLGLALEGAELTSQTFGDNEFLQRELSNNAALLQQARDLYKTSGTRSGDGRAPAADNRAVLIQRGQAQAIARSKNVATQLPSNFDVSASGEDRRDTDSRRYTAEPEFNWKWFGANELPSPEIGKLTAPGRPVPDVAKGLAVPLTPDLTAGTNVEAEGRAAASALGRRLAQEAADREANHAPARDQAAAVPELRKVEDARGERQDQLQRYQARLEEQQDQARQLGRQAGEADARGGRSDQQRVGGAAPPGGDFGPMEGAQGAPSPAPQGAERLEAAGLRSLDVDLPRRGQTYHFLTMRGDVELTARAIPARQAKRLVGLAAILLALVLVAACRRHWPTDVRTP